MSKRLPGPDDIWGLGNFPHPVGIRGLFVCNRHRVCCWVEILHLKRNRKKIGRWGKAHIPSHLFSIQEENRFFCMYCTGLHHAVSELKVKLWTNPNNHRCLLTIKEETWTSFTLVNCVTSRLKDWRANTWGCFHSRNFSNKPEDLTWTG